jgi:hypothetical protein
MAQNYLSSMGIIPRVIPQGRTIPFADGITVHGGGSTGTKITKVSGGGDYYYTLPASAGTSGQALRCTADVDVQEWYTPTESTSGQFTPTFSNFTLWNSVGITGSGGHWIRVGDIVSVSGRLNIAPVGTSVTNVLHIFDMTLPVARSTDWATSQDIHGSCIAYKFSGANYETGAGHINQGTGQTARVYCSLAPTVTTTYVLIYNFKYLVN